MARDSSGTYTLPSDVNPVVEDTTITAAWANDTLNDITTELTDSLSRSAKGAMLGQLKIVDGSLSTPGLGFANDLNTGVARLSAGTVSFVVDGVDVLKVSQTALTFGASVAPTFPSGTSPVWAGVPTANSHLTNKLYVDNLAFATQLPLQTGNAGKVPRTNGTSVAWDDAWGAATALTGATTLVARTTYNADSSGGSFSVNLPAAPAVGDWVIIRDVGRSCGAFPITLANNGSNVYGASQDYIMDVSGESVMLVVDTTKGWVRG